MKNLRPLLAIAVLLLTTACTAAGLFVINAPSHFNDVGIVHDVAFGPQDWEKLDIYTPPVNMPGPHDVVVFYYGGRWEEGAKEQYRFVGSALAQCGFLVVIPDYRKYPQVGFPQFVDDAATSLAWTSRNIARFGGDPAHIHVAGHSAGAHIGALLVTDAAYLRAKGLDRSKVIEDFAGLAGPYSFTPTDKDLVAMFGPPSRYPLMQATTFIDGKQPPMLLLWGDKDQYVGKINIDRMTKAIDVKGGCLDTKIYPGVDHIDIVSAFSFIGNKNAPVADDMSHFFRRDDSASGCKR